jgi:hypothetical protein
MPTSYPDLNAKDLIRIKSYPVREWGDMIWAYMGPASSAGIARSGDGAGAGPRTATSPRSGRTATGCRRWKARSTPRISLSRISPSKRKENEILDIKKHFVNPLTRVATDHMRWIAEDPRPGDQDQSARGPASSVAGGRLTGPTTSTGASPSS